METYKKGNKEMKKNKVIFIGNRYYCYEVIRKEKFEIVETYAVKGSFLEKYLINNNIEYKILPPKEEFINEISLLEYDILISNGCPYILPISILKKESEKKFINIHPSLLPDLKGRNPINGAILFNRKHGVTCHLMDDGIDTGQIISQIEIPLKRDYDVRLLYKITFMMEAQVLKNAIDNGFNVDYKARLISNPIYYSFKDGDNKIDVGDDDNLIYRKIKAFSIAGKYAFIDKNHERLLLKDIREIKDSYLINKYRQYHNKVLIDLGEGYYLVKLKNLLAEVELVPFQNINFKENEKFI